MDRAMAILGRLRGIADGDLLIFLATVSVGVLVTIPFWISAVRERRKAKAEQIAKLSPVMADIFELERMMSL